MAKKSESGVAPVALRPALPRSARQATAKQKPSALVDTRVIYCGDNLDDPGWFKPAMDMFVGDAQPWDIMEPT